MTIVIAVLRHFSPVCAAQNRDALQHPDVLTAPSDHSLLLCSNPGNGSGMRLLTFASGYMQKSYLLMPWRT
jgi:hypothetical protein